MKRKERINKRTKETNIRKREKKAEKKSAILLYT